MNWFAYLSVMGASAFKYMFGAISGAAIGLAWYESLICSMIGMLLMNVSVMQLGSLFGKLEKRFAKKRRKKNPFNKRTRWAIKIRQRLGMWGIAFLTPVVFTPPLGAFLAVTFGYSRREILIKMFFSSLAWGSFFVFFFYYLKDTFFP